MNEHTKYVISDGEIIRKTDLTLSLQNRAFRYGDALFETIHAYGTKIQFLKDHISRLVSSMLTLKMEIPEDFNENIFSQKFPKLLYRNKTYKGARIRLTIYRKEGGFYTPFTNEISYLVETEELENSFYTLNDFGLHIGIFNEMEKPIQLLSNLKTANSLIYILAGIYNKENNYSDCIIMNTNHKICEFISSNIFLSIHNQLYTPPLNAGCVNGVMRKNIIEIAEKLSYKVHFKNMDVAVLEQADEVFSTNAIKGIQWVGAYKNKRYYKTISNMISNELNKVAFNKV